MWVHFNFLCNAETQIKLHKTFRSKISEWRISRLIDDAVLTYHFHNPRAPTDSLYVCLNMPSVKLPQNRSKFVSEETVKQIPKEIKDMMRIRASENLINPFMDRLEIIDYEFELICNNSPLQYGYAPIEEIIRFASKGTEIALEILDDFKTKNRTWRNDKEIAETIVKLINERLTTQRERSYGLHFVCNPMGLWGLEPYLMNIMSKPIDPNAHVALDSLYRIEGAS